MKKISQHLWAGQRRRLAHLRREHRQTAEAYRLKLAFADFYEQPTEVAEVYLAEWRWRSSAAWIPLVNNQIAVGDVRAELDPVGDGVGFEGLKALLADPGLVEGP